MTNDKPALRVFKVGDLLTVVHGEYSDYSNDATVRIVAECNTIDLAHAYRAACALDGGDVEGGSYFTEWLVKAGFAEAIENHHEWNVGDYGFSPS